MRTSPAAAAPLTVIETACVNRQRTAHKVMFTPFTLMVAYSVYVLRFILNMHERNAGKNHEIKTYALIPKTTWRRWCQ